MNQITISGNQFALYTPKKDYFTPDDHSEIEQLKKSTGRDVAVDGSGLDYISAGDARRLNKRGNVIVNPKPGLEQKLSIYNNTGIPVQSVSITGQGFDGMA